MSSSPAAVREALGIVYCPTCQQDTMPLEPSGICAFCDLQLVPPAPKRSRLSTLPIPPVQLPGRCVMCEGPLPKFKQKFCSDAHKQAYWVRYTARGRAWVARTNAKKAA